MRFKGAEAGKRKLGSPISPPATARFYWTTAVLSCFEPSTRASQNLLCSDLNNDVKVLYWILDDEVSLWATNNAPSWAFDVKCQRNLEESKTIKNVWMTEGNHRKNMGEVGRTRNTLHYVPHLGKLLIEDLYFYERLYSLSTNVDYRLKWR